MSDSIVISDGNRQVSDKALMELKLRLDPFFKGRNEASGGNGWEFDKDNEGGSGYVQTNAPLDVDEYPDPLSVGGTWGLVFEDDSDGLLLGSTSQVLIKGFHAPVNIIMAGGSYVRIGAPGDLWVFLDSNGNPIVTYTA